MTGSSRWFNYNAQVGSSGSMALVLVEFIGRKVKENRSGAAAAKAGTRGRLGFSARDSFWMGNNRAGTRSSCSFFSRRRRQRLGEEKATG
jgi:hypothetical protein